MLHAGLETAHKGLSDAEIAQRVAAGDEDAFHLLMRRHNQTLYRAARSILKDDAEAEDAVQESYLLAYRAIASFRGDAKLSTWLVRIVVNESIARSRKRSRAAQVIRLDGDSEHEEVRHGVPEEDLGDDVSGQPEANARRAETRRLLEKKSRRTARFIPRCIHAAGGRRDEHRGSGGRTRHTRCHRAHALFSRPGFAARSAGA